MKDSDPDRPTRLADAAIDVLGRDGLRALTHRAVDARAGLPQGTCSYHHRTRRSLLRAALTRIADLDRADQAVAATPGAPTPGSPTPAAPAADTPTADTVPAADTLERAAAVLAHWLGPARIRSRARLVLMLDAEARRDLGDLARSLADGFVTRAEAALGSAERARLLVALLDGLIADDLSRGGDTGPSHAAVRTRVAAVLAAVAAADPDAGSTPQRRTARSA